MPRSQVGDTVQEDIKNRKGTRMKRIVAGLMISLDGVVEAPETWSGPYFSPELGQVVTRDLGDVSSLCAGVKGADPMFLSCGPREDEVQWPGRHHSRPGPGRRGQARLLVCLRDAVVGLRPGPVGPTQRRKPWVGGQATRRREKGARWPSSRNVELRGP